MPDIRPAQASWDLIDTLRRNWDMRVNYVPIRIAIGRSLLSGDVIKAEDYPDDNKRAIDTQQIFGGGGADYASLFRALIVQRHGCSVGDDEFLPLLKAHVDHGFNLIRGDAETFRSSDDWVDYLIELTESGLEQRKREDAPNVEATAAFDGVLRLELGTDARSSEGVTVEFNRRTNNYLAVTGKPGSGKTQFVKDLLVQLRRNSDYKLNFVFFDYAKGDVAGDTKFIEAARAETIGLPHESLPVNPFSRVDVDSEMQVRLAAQEFSDTVRDIERGMGATQGQLLYDAITAAFADARNRTPPYPDFYRVRGELETLYRNANRKPDTLSEVLRQLTDFQLFARADAKDVWGTISSRTVVVDLHELTVLRELTVCLILTALHRELMRMPDTIVTDGARAMRTVIVIDEAHHFLKDKKRSRVLQRLIREIRSKGASVFLLSQSPDDYATEEFDFAELLEFVFVLQSSASSANKFLQSALGVSPQRARTLVAEINNLASGQGFTKQFDSSHDGKRDAVAQLNLRQFWRDWM